MRLIAKRFPAVELLQKPFTQISNIEAAHSLGSIPHSDDTSPIFYEQSDLLTAVSPRCLYEAGGDVWLREELLSLSRC